MELLLALIVIALAVLGMAVGVLFGSGPMRSSCGAAACLPNGNCDDCPLHRRNEAEDTQ